MIVRHLIHAASATAAAFVFLGCGGDKEGPVEKKEAGEEHAEHAAAAPAVKPTGRSTKVAMISDLKGERYDPKEFEVTRGDSLHFLLQSGVHNVHFVVEKNPSGVKLPPMSEYLQLPGQKVSYLIDFPEGRYYFQCDIHVAVGMIGYVKVEDDIQ
jgi:plastocyanin